MKKHNFTQRLSMERGSYYFIVVRVLSTTRDILTNAIPKEVKDRVKNGVDLTGIGPFGILIIHHKFFTTFFSTSQKIINYVITSLVL